MNNLRDYYERALEVFGTSDEGELAELKCRAKCNEGVEFQTT